jgi:hypothetical protein
MEENMNFPKIIDVIPEANMILLVKFENGITKRMDIKAYGEGIKPFEKLRNKKLFSKVKIDNCGHVIVWDKMLDIDGADVWEYGKMLEVQRKSGAI